MKLQSHKSWNLVAGIILPVITLILSAPLVRYALYHFIMRYHQWPSTPRAETLFSVSLLAVFLLGNAAMFLRPRRLGYFLVVVFFIGFAYAGVYEMQSRWFSPTPMWFKGEYGVGGQRKLERYQVVKIEQSQGRLPRVHLRFVDSSYLPRYDRRLVPPIEAGCCMRPGECELETVNATLHITRNREGPPLETALIYGRYGGTADIKDYYDMWRHELSVLYYDCMTCKVTIIKSPRLRKWWQFGVFFSSLTSLFR
ncbi:PREDICTED: tetraspanin-14-like [Camelina sativa]|uniref:Tetraspanin-14-like n=1 Tax=Camelina sativa TaxID=90675 RepID=A0ABM0YK21_CAMSA|nr:PREDICTED: tetraspanin-14-like [Camelina sativa]